MAKKSLLGKLFTIAAAAAAIGGACYIFKDKIKASKLYEDLDVDDKLHSLKNILKKNDDEEDFFDEDEYIFNTEEDDSNRTYVSLNAEPATADVPAVKEEAPKEDTPKEDETVPTIALDTIPDSENSFTSEDTKKEDTPSDTKGETPTSYDMEGLSDVSEDPDVLMEQDLLDDSPFEFY